MLAKVEKQVKSHYNKANINLFRIMKYLFILGNNPELSVAEIQAVLGKVKVILQCRQYLLADCSKFDCQKIMRQLGGTIKIGMVVGKRPSEGPVLDLAFSQSGPGRFNFGLSFYGVKPNNLGMKIKRLLKEKGLPARLVVSREPALSSVIVTKEKCHDFLVGPDFFGLTCAVQDFEGYGQRDYGRPQSDALSGMLPPKLARMMVNLSELEPEQTLLDPFCGSGTILAEALDLGFKNLMASDISAKAVSDTEKNSQWLVKKFKLSNFKFQIFNCDVKALSSKIKIGSVAGVVTEPYLGPALKGNEKKETILNIISEVEGLYQAALAEFKKILKPKGKVVMIWPQWHLGQQIFDLNLSDATAKIGFKRLDDNNLMYKREEQRVWRRVVILEKI
jgi:tRNA (guanine10-N2)-dimethyltransferase